MSELFDLSDSPYWGNYIIMEYLCAMSSPNCYTITIHSIHCYPNMIVSKSQINEGNHYNDLGLGVQTYMEGKFTINCDIMAYASCLHEGNMGSNKFDIYLSSTINDAFRVIFVPAGEYDEDHNRSFTEVKPLEF